MCTSISIEDDEIVEENERFSFALTSDDPIDFVGSNGDVFIVDGDSKWIGSIDLITHSVVYYSIVCIINTALIHLSMQLSLLPGNKIHTLSMRLLR